MNNIPIDFKISTDKANRLSEIAENNGLSVSPQVRLLVKSSLGNGDVLKIPRKVKIRLYVDEELKKELDRIAEIHNITTQAIVSIMLTESLGGGNNGKN
jgi:antitoxin component of RelBE/YafQ-DinJ toxin-antitoxin module